MTKRTYLVPMVALAAFSGPALAKVGIEVPGSTDKPVENITDPTIARAFKDATEQSLAIYKRDGDLFSYTLDRQPDGTLLAQHRSHMSHESHHSHSSHRSHSSSRW